MGIPAKNIKIDIGNIPTMRKRMQVPEIAIDPETEYSPPPLKDQKRLEVNPFEIPLQTQKREE